MAGQLPYVLTAIPSLIPVKLGLLKPGVKKVVITKIKHSKLIAVLEPGGGLFE